MDIEDLIAQNKYLLIEGHPGSGKTTLLKHLAYNIVQGIVCKGLEDHLPILIFLKDLSNFKQKEYYSTGCNCRGDDVILLWGYRKWTRL